jgi:hypothetical protein
MAAKKMSEVSKELSDKNFLEEVIEGVDIPTVEKPVVVSTHIPEMKEVMFINNRDPGAVLHFHYHSKTHPLKHYDLVHGQKYNLPVEIIEHLEGEGSIEPWTCHSRLYSRRMRPDGISETYASGYTQYFTCRSEKAMR